MDNKINIKYMFTVIGGGWERVSRAYFIADDSRPYFPCTLYGRVPGSTQKGGIVWNTWIQ